MKYTFYICFGKWKIITIVLEPRLLALLMGLRQTLVWWKQPNKLR